MRGDSISPISCALRTEKTMLFFVPQSRSVVTPAESASFACLIASAMKSSSDMLK